MPWLVALMLALGMVTAAGAASAAVYVPGHVRDGVYTRPHFLDAPEVRYDRPVKLDGEQANPPKPTIIDKPPPAELPPAAPVLERPRSGPRPTLAAAMHLAASLPRRSAAARPVAVGTHRPLEDRAGSWAPRG